MNHHILHATNNNDAKNLPLKAYFLNKYEHLKKPMETVDNMGERSLLNSVETETLPKNLGSRMNSSSRLHFSGSNSSLINSDEEDEYADVGNGNSYVADHSREEKRRISHTAAEQKRRNAIKRGYDDLQSLVPSCEFMDPSSSQKVCKATVLKRSIDYIHEMEKEKDKHERELDSLKKEIIALKIMKSNYDEILQFHRNQPKDNSVEINDDAVFDLFVKFSDNLFQSFQSMISANSFAEITSSTLGWLEQMCTTNNLKNLVLLSLYQVIK